MLEAQASGLPCVISSEITEEAVLLKEKVCRLSLEESDEKWADAVLAYAKNGREEKENAARFLMAAHFDIHQEAGKLLELYKKQGEQHGKQN